MVKRRRTAHRRYGGVTVQRVTHCVDGVTVSMRVPGQTTQRRPCLPPPVVEVGEVGAYLVGFGYAEFGIDVQGVLPLAAGLLDVAGGVVGMGEAVVSAGLL